MVCPAGPPSSAGFFLGVLFKNPRWLKEMNGTVSLTAVGMFGAGGGWGIPPPTTRSRSRWEVSPKMPILIKWSIGDREFPVRDDQL